MERYKVRSRWSRMLSRCEDFDNPGYKDYGGRGITVCEEWRSFDAFYSWVTENGITSERHLDRIDNNGNYCPDNCRFATKGQNARNKRNNVHLTAFGETKLMIEWSEDSRCNVTYKTLLVRILRGWDHERAISLPADSTRKGKCASNARTLTAFGETKTTSDWCKDDRCMVSPKTLWARLKVGWSPENAISRPPRKVAS